MSKCTQWVDQGVIGCKAWADEATLTCVQWADEGSNQCGQWADEGSSWPRSTNPSTTRTWKERRITRS